MPTDPPERSLDFPARPQWPLSVGISACLAGEVVRYDGTDAAFALPSEQLRGLVELCGLCPEVGIGMGVPRPPIRLVGDLDSPRALRVDKPSVDVTAALSAFAEARKGFLDKVFGFIFMERSPSCGLASVKVRAEVRGEPLRCDGRGVFAASVLRQHPQLPVAENSRLGTAPERDAFLARVATYAHWRRLQAFGLTPERLIEFHARHKYLLMAHSVAHYRRCGRLLSNLRDGVAEAGRDYFACLMQGLGRPATAGGHANALAHMGGYLRGRLTGAEARRLQAAVRGCRLGAAAPQKALALLRELLRRHPNPYLQRQVYLHPLP